MYLEEGSIRTTLSPPPIWRELAFSESKEGLEIFLD